MATLEGLFLDYSTLKMKALRSFRNVGSFFETIQRSYFPQQPVLNGSSYARCDQSSYPSFFLLHEGRSFCGARWRSG
jgi:hypothetical protein